MLKVYSFRKFPNFAFSMLNNLGLFQKTLGICSFILGLSLLFLFKCHLFRKAFLNYSMSQCLLTPIILLLPIYILTLNYIIYLCTFLSLPLENKLHVGNLFCCIFFFFNLAFIID